MSDTDTPSRPHVSEQPSLADLGVLLVHGIGRSRAGDTLVHFGEPLVSWLCDWGGETARVEVTDAVLGVEAAEPSTRPHTRLKVTVPVEGEPGEEATVEREWLLAESWWAESFASPTFRELTDWGVRLVPLTLFFHFSRRSDRARAAVRRAWAARPRRIRTVLSKTVRWLIDFTALLLAILLAPLFMVLLLLLVVGGLVPIPRFRSWIGRLQRGLAVTVGDSYSLLGPKIGSEAIYGRVRRDLEWLSKRARRVAVVAHSQGAAIAYRVVSRDRSGKVGLLVTFGAGIRKLGQIRRIKEGGSGWIGWVSLALGLLILAVHLSRRQLGLGGGMLLAAVVPVAWFGGSAFLGLTLRGIWSLWARIKSRPPAPIDERWNLWLGLASALLALAPLAWFLPGPSLTGRIWLVLLTFLAWAWVFGAVAAAGDDSADLLMTLPKEGRARPPGEQPLPDSMRWVDVYASHDPVSNGPIFDGVSVFPLDSAFASHGLTTFETVNRESTLSDHSTYWRNPEGFTSLVAAELGRLTEVELGEIRAFDSERLILARHRRTWRARWLRRSRYALLFAVAAVWTTGAARELSADLYRVAAQFLLDLPVLGRLLGPFLPRSLDSSPITELIAISIAGLVALALTSAAWNRWDAADRKTVVDRRPYRVPDGRFHPSTLFHLSWITVVAAAGALILDAGRLPWWALTLLGVITWIVGAAVATLDPFEGSLGDGWQKMLVRIGIDAEAAARDWGERLRERAVVLIDPIEVDGRTVWEAGVTLDFRGAATAWEETARLEDTATAVRWGRARVDSVYVARDGRYQPARDDAIDP